jgi:Flp pilus assembly protein TadG
MMIRHHHPKLVQTQAGRHREGGYVLVMSALLLVPLLLMAGLSVDVGNWYSNASNIQKAADAAALAGVVWLPDTASATNFAAAAAKRNGYEDGVNGVTVKVERIGDRRLRVTIKDPAVGSFFYQNLGGKKISLSRSGTAEYVLPVPLGSPDNRFGNDLVDVPTAGNPNLWGNIHGVQTDSVKGDAFAPACDGKDNCTPGASTYQNISYRPEGYLYTIDVGSAVQGFDLQIYDAALDPRSAETVDTGDTAYTGTGTTNTVWTFYKFDSTELVTDDNPVADATTCPSQSGLRTWTLPQATTSSPSAYKNKWMSLCKNTGTMAPGRYLLRVQTTGNGSAANRYAIRVLATSTTKPRIAGFGDMSMYNNISAGSSAVDVSANFYLAEVDPIHRGKTFRISMYDPGEVSKVGSTTGKGTVKVIVPGNTVATSCVATSDSSLSTFTSGSTLSPCQYDSAVGGEAKFNGSWVTLDIKIPNDYTCTMNTLPGCWWKIQYVINGQANDTTTWAAQVIGDPVHLVEE